jgi:hypothetical protein
MKGKILILVILIYIYLAYNYLSNLKSCSCVEGDYVDNVKTSEGFIMAVLLFWIFTNLTKQENPIFSGALSVILFLSYIYFCYYVYQMNMSITPQCLCAMKWQHWLIDIQYGILLLEIFLVYAKMFSN